MYPHLVVDGEEVEQRIGVYGLLGHRYRHGAHRQVALVARPSVGFTHGGIVGSDADGGGEVVQLRGLRGHPVEGQVV